MSDIVEFEDYSAKVKEAMRKEAISFLKEVGGELRSLTERKSRKKSSKTAGSYKYVVDESQLAVHIGSDYENAVWEEFGTGIHASETGHVGRKGWWVYVTGSASKTPSKDSKSYSSPEEAKKVVAILKSKGLDAHMTQGKKANRPLLKAFTSSKSKIIKRANEIYKGLNS